MGRVARATALGVSGRKQPSARVLDAMRLAVLSAKQESITNPQLIRRRMNAARAEAKRELQREAAAKEEARAAENAEHVARMRKALGQD